MSLDFYEKPTDCEDEISRMIDKFYRTKVGISGIIPENYQFYIEQEIICIKGRHARNKELRKPPPADGSWKFQP